MVQFHTQTPCERVGSGTVGGVGGRGSVICEVTWGGGGGGEVTWGTVNGVHACEWGL